MKLEIKDLDKTKFSYNFFANLKDQSEQGLGKYWPSFLRKINVLTTMEAFIIKLVKVELLILQQLESILLPSKKK